MVSIKQQGAVIKDFIFVQVSGIAGNFPSIHRDIVFAFKSRIQSQAMKKKNDGPGEFPEINEIFSSLGKNKGEIDVARIMVNSSSPGDPSDDRDLIFFNEIRIDLLQRILMFSDDDGRIIPPGHKGILCRGLKNVLFCSKVIIRIGFLALNKAQHQIEIVAKLYYLNKKS